jgi:NAD(P)-dependent dehydrogenase (short-subunit alcohol dehydrogenase family)
MTDDPVRTMGSPSFEGRTALVTGAAGDIGRAVTIRLARAAAAVVAADHPGARERLDATIAACLDACPDAAVRPVTFDVTDAAATRRAIDAAAADLAAFDLVFNNAGIQGAFAPTHRYPLDDAAAVINVNVTGALNVMTTAAAVMVAAGIPGAIVNAASMAGVTGAPNMVAYSASKAAIIGMTKSAAKDLAPHGIRVNCTSPAFIGPGAMWERQVELQAAADTQYFPPDPDQVARMMISSVPMRRYGSLDEVVDVVLWLLSDQASYVTGVNVEVSGGAA